MKKVKSSQPRHCRDLFTPHTAWVALSLVLPAQLVAETPNPFGTGDAPPVQVDPRTLLDDSDDLQAEAPSVPAPADPVIPPPPAAPARRVVAPTPPRAVAPTPPRAARSAARPQPTAAVSQKAATNSSKLADYLSLDSTVKGLEVKNFDLPDKEIRDVVTLISKWTGKNFILDAKVRGKITILGPSQVTLEEAYQAFLSALDANGLTTVKAGKFIRIIESAEARRAPVETFSGDYAPDTDQFITRIFQLKYINADEVQREFRDLTSRQGKLFAYEPTNSIIITDSGSNIKRIQEILDTLDVKSFETTLHVLRIKHTSSKSIAEMLGEIYGSEGPGSTPGRPTTSRARTFRRSALERTRGGGIISKIIPDEQTNSLLVLANRSGFEQLTQLVRKLDVQVSDTGRIHVYYCEYAKAEDLAATLASLTGGGAGSPASAGRAGGRTTSGRTGGVGLGGSPQGGGLARSGPVTAELEGGAKITSDAATNALVITANSGDFQTLKRVIKKLDIPRLQVFVETAILEVNIDRDTSYGVNLAASVPGRAFAGGFIGDPQSLTSMLTNGLPSPGFSIPIVAGNALQSPIQLGNITQNVTTFPFMGLINLITSRTNSSVLSTPQIIAMDNEKAEFKVLDETPVQTSFVAAVGQGGVGAIGAAGQGNIENRKTGIEINLTPHINAASKSIRLEIEQKIDSIRNAGVPQALQGVQIATTSRVTNTTVVVKDQDYVMLGGLMSDKIDEEVKKVPLLGDIPILGWLFKAKTYKNIKTNLVILLRPRIIGTSISAATIIDTSMEEHDEFVEDNLGDDPHEKRIKPIRKSIDRQKTGASADPFSSYRNNPEDDDEGISLGDEQGEPTSKRPRPDPKRGEGSAPGLVQPPAQKQSQAPAEPAAASEVFEPAPEAEASDFETPALLPDSSSDAPGFTPLPEPPPLDAGE